MGGSMARFTIMNDRMYTVGTSNLDVFNISNPENPLNTARKNIGWNIETIYPFKDKLFIGTTTSKYVFCFMALFCNGDLATQFDIIQV